jgi:hypothetical protein
MGSATRGTTRYARDVPLNPPPRIVTLVLVSPDGDVLGQLPSFTAATPWWQDAGPVVAGARGRFDLDVTILRLLHADRPAAHGGAVTYLAEADPVAVAAVGPKAGLAAWEGTLTHHPKRLPYARPGGPAADLAWADGILAALGQSRNGVAEQVRTWNLSSLWRLPTGLGDAWLKVVPAFFEHEGAVIERLQGEAVPTLLGRNRGRMLFAEIAGDDRYDATGPELHEMIDGLVDLQARWLDRVDELLSLGLPDWRVGALSRAIAELIDRSDPWLEATDGAALAAFVDTLPARLDSIATAGIPDALVHGDFHPGNFRGEPGRLVLLDWGDSGIGHPLLDQPAFLSRVDPTAVAGARSRWHAAWRRALPGSDPDRASELLAPIAAARQAVIYQQFLDHIEPSEHPYHRADVPDWLHRTADILRTEAT